MDLAGSRGELFPALVWALSLSSCLLLAWFSKWGRLAEESSEEEATLPLGTLGGTCGVLGKPPAISCQPGMYLSSFVSSSPLPCGDRQRAGPRLGARVFSAPEAVWLGLRQLPSLVLSVFVSVWELS